MKNGEKNLCLLCELINVHINQIIIVKIIDNRNNNDIDKNRIGDAQLLNVKL